MLITTLQLVTSELLIYRAEKCWDCEEEGMERTSEFMDIEIMPHENKSSIIRGLLRTNIDHIRFFQTLGAHHFLPH